MHLISRIRNRLPSLALAGLLVAIPAACTHAGQVTLKFGQCVLDDGILGRVFAALGQDDYAQAVAGIALQEAPSLVECALRAIASQSDAGAGSGSARLAQDTPIQVLRAREILASRARAPGGSQ